MQFDFSLLEMFIVLCVGLSLLTVSDLVINAIKDSTKE
jgi:hypothetical protein